LWSSELAGPASLTAPTAQISIPLPPAPKPVAVVPATAYPDGITISTDTCFERAPEAWLTAEADQNEYAPYGDFATGVEGAAVILAVYKPHPDMAWDYAERCNAPGFYKHAKIIKKLRTSSLASDVPYGRIIDASWNSSAHPSKKSRYGVAARPPNVLDTGYGGSGFGPGGGGGGQGFTGDTGSSDDGRSDPPGGKNPPITNPGGDGPDGGSGGPGDTGPGNPDPGNPGSGDPDPGQPGPGGQNPGGPGYPGGSDPIAVPEPGTLALFLGSMIGFALIRRRACRI
jgi:hypothetical protein